MSSFVLIYFDPEGDERRFDLEDGRSYRLGAREDNDIVIDQQDVSRHHAILRVSSGTFYLTDLKSKNGSFINGNRAEEAAFRAGDLLSLSSARLIVVEPGSDEFLVDRGDDVSSPSGDTSNTIERRIQISAEELVELLEITGNAVEHCAIAEPLGWAGRTLGLKGTLMLYSDDDERISVVSSAGDLGPLMTNSEALWALVRNANAGSRQSTQIKRFPEVDEDFLVAPVGGGHCLVVRYGGSAPAVGDIRALVASLVAVLASCRKGRIAGKVDRRPAPSLSGTGGFLDLEAVLLMPLAEGRDHFERWFVSSVLDACGGNQSEAARRLGVSRAGLFKKLKKLGLKE